MNGRLKGTAWKEKVAGRTPVLYPSTVSLAFRLPALPPSSLSAFRSFRLQDPLSSGKVFATENRLPACVPPIPRVPAFSSTT